MPFSRWRDLFRAHWPLGLLAVIALALLLTNLGSDYLWADEGDTAVLASSITKCGLPKAWDGVTFSDADKGARLNRDLVMVSHPWAQYYLTAFSFLCFGQTAFAARLPFALAGWLTVLLIYAWTWQMTANRRTAFAAATLLLLSVQFLLYCRQCRNYSVNMLLTCLLIWIFLRLKSRRDAVLFAVAAILLFHTQPLGLVPVGVAGILTLISRRFAAQRRCFWFSFPVILLFTSPWLIWARRGYAESTQIFPAFGLFVRRLLQYAIEVTSITPLLGVLVLLAVLVWSQRRQPREAAALNDEEQSLLLVTFLSLAAYGLALALTQSSNLLWLQGLRYAPALLPLCIMLAAILIERVSRKRVLVWLGLFLCFGFTQLPQLTPWISWYGDVEWPEKTEIVQAHVPARLLDCFARTEQFLFLRDLWHDNPGVVGRACEFLRKEAQPGDGLIANYCWEPLYFHTGLPQCLKILPNYPVNEQARRDGLPDYVFEVDHARWIVWREFWEGYQDYRWADVSGAITAKGGQITRVQDLEETFWENREYLPFRRFSGGRHLYPWPQTFPSAAVFRVDWPADDRFKTR